MVLATLLFAIMGVAVKYASAHYGAGELVGFDRFTEVKRVLEAFVARPAVQRGLNIPKRPG